MKFWKAASIEIEYEKETEAYTNTEPKPTGKVQIDGVEFDLKEFM